jgi:hypothetical protein
MVFGNADYDTVQKVMLALSAGLKRAEMKTPDGRKVTGYYIKDNQVRIDIVEAPVK